MTAITIIDYGTSNLGSMQNMLRKLNISSIIASRADDVIHAEKLILPGVGSFDPGIKKLRESGMLEALNQKVLTEKTPILGVCLGMQLLGKKSEEGNELGLGWLDMTVKKFNVEDYPAMRVPHMGWNEVNVRNDCALVSDPPERWRFYFANSYHMTCNDPADIVLETEYQGFVFASAVRRGNIMGAQFHPEKSHRYGMWFLENFANNY